MGKRLHVRRGRPAIPVSAEVIKSLHCQGYSFRAISLVLGVGYGTVRRAFHGLVPASEAPVADQGASYRTPGKAVRKRTVRSLAAAPPGIPKNRTRRSAVGR